MLICIELTFVVALALAAFTLPGIGAKGLARVELCFSRLARRRRLALLAVGALAIAMRIAALPILPIPQPGIDDEFSYLLQADTYLHGRLTNPTHPMWTHLETFHVNMLPTYQSKYPPAQGLVLAAGRLIGGYPIVGVWLSMAAMCAAVCWMLQEWISPEWAMVGALILGIRLSVFSYWGNSYWGGAVPATGGALLLGGLVRLVKSPRVRDALLMGLGIAILANSRPFEGLLLCIPVSVFLLFWWLRKERAEFFRVMRRAVLPLALCVAITAVGMGYYNWRVTGRALRLPYEVNEMTYSVAPLFIFQSPRPQPAYRSDALRDFYLFLALPQYQQTRSVSGLLLSWYQRMQKIWLVLLGPALTLPLLVAPLIRPRELRWRLLDWQKRLLVWASAVSIAGLALEVYGLPHYAAPMTCVLMALVLLAMRRMRRWEWRGRPAGVFLSRAIPLTCLLMLVLRAAAAPLHIDTGPAWPPTWYNSHSSEKMPRNEFERRIDNFPGKSLVLVSYKSDGKPDIPHEWVYNAADIDSAKIVWAWDMGAAKNQELIDYFKDRQVWRIQATRISSPQAAQGLAGSAALSLWVKIRDRLQRWNQWVSFRP
jgi:hypothetical protein